MTITGSRFGDSRGASFVSFNGVFPATYISWADTSITCVAPVGTRSGPVTVTTREGTSNAVLFTVTRQSWHLAEGCTGTNADGSFETWVLVQNPGSRPVNVELVFQTGSGKVAGPGDTIPAYSRKTYNAGDYVDSFDVSTVVRAGDGVVCERAMYSTERSWGHGSVGHAP